MRRAIVVLLALVLLLVARGAAAREDKDAHWAVVAPAQVNPSFIEEQNRHFEHDYNEREIFVVIVENEKWSDEGIEKVRALAEAHFLTAGRPVLIVVGRTDGKVLLEAKGWSRERRDRAYAEMKATAAPPVEEKDLRAIADIAVAAELAAEAARVPPKPTTEDVLWESPVVVVGVIALLVVGFVIYLANRKLGSFRDPPVQTSDSDTSPSYGGSSSVDTSPSVDTSSSSSSSNDTYTGGGGSSGGGGSTDSW